MTTTTTTTTTNDAARSPSSAPHHPILSYAELLERQRHLQERLQRLAIPPIPSKARTATTTTTASSSSTSAATTTAAVSLPTTNDSTTATVFPLVVVMEEKSDTHFDFLLKEMQWLAADFAGERKRHVSACRKVSSAMQQYRATKRQRHVQQLALAETKRRRLAARLGRLVVKGWWKKMEQVITYKQKVQAEQARNEAMNRQLVKLVKQTEKYSDSLVKSATQLLGREEDEEEEDDDGDNNNNDGDDDKGEQRSTLTIEQALQGGLEMRRSKTRVTDYAQLLRRQEQEQQDHPADYDDGHGHFFHASSSLLSSSSSSSSSSYDPDRDDEAMHGDDETTLLEAIREECLDRKKQQRQRRLGKDGDGPDANDNDDDDDVKNQSFRADPMELKQLKEEQAMSIEQVLERLRREGDAASNAEQNDEDEDDDEAEPLMQNDNDDDQSQQDTIRTRGKRRKRVTFTLRSEPATDHEVGVERHGRETTTDATESDTSGALEEEEKEEEDDDDGEFLDNEQAVDDETTMEAEEKLPPEMSPEEEIKLLQAENDISVEELRRRYAQVLAEKPDRDTAEEVEEMDEASNDEIADEESEPEDEEEEDGLMAGVAAKDDEQAKLQNLFLANDDNDEDDNSVEEFQPAAGMDVDDETTMEAEEKLQRDMSYEAEIDLLTRESEIPIEELRKQYAAVLGQGTADTSQEKDEGLESSSDENKDTSRGNVWGAYLFSEGDNGDEEADEFEPMDANPVDDEETIEAEEKLGREMSYEEELALLKRESEMSVEELRALYAPKHGSEEDENTSEDNDDGQELGSSILAHLDQAVEDQENDDEFLPDLTQRDDETTIEAEEKLGREMSSEAEIALLREESEIPIESLRKMYQEKSEQSGSSQARKRKRDEQAGEESAPSETGEDEESDSDGDSLDAGKALDALEASAEKARTTQVTRPYLLSSWVKLREYQQIGLNWLVNMAERRLNGILAGEY